MNADQATKTRRAARQSCSDDIAIVDNLGRKFAGRLGNLSQGGFMAESADKVEIGTIISVSLPERGVVRAEVRWSLGWRFGAMILD